MDGEAVVNISSAQATVESDQIVMIVMIDILVLYYLTYLPSPV
jgi:hypothetical protein